MQSQPVPPSGIKMGHSIPYLDGVRGMAIFLVATGHIFYEFYLSKIGWIGLNLFFVLSGYLITRCLFQYKSYSASGYFRNFYFRRILRIFPLYYAVLIFFFFLLPLLSYKTGHYYDGLKNIQGYYWLYSSNWNMIRNGLPEQPVFFHFWSLAVEEQFYLVWPLLFLVCYSSKAKYIVISGLLLLSVVSRIMTEAPLNAYLSSFTAAEPLLLGCLLCVLQEEGKLQKIGRYLNVAALLALFLLVYIFLKNHDLHISNSLLIKYGYSAIDIIWAALICNMLVGYASGKKLREYFSTKWLRWLGKYSYSIYVFHWIFLQIFVYKMQSLMATYCPGWLCYIVPRVFGVILTLVISYFSYHWFEKHFLRMKQHFSDDVRRKWSFSFPWQAKPVQ